MNSNFKRMATAITVALVFGAGMIYLPVSLAGSPNDLVVLPQQAGAILTTRNNQPISVNGSSAVGGATVMSGATVETPGQVNASLTFPSQFTLDISPGSSIIIEFSANSVKVTLIKGCVSLHTRKGTTGEIVYGQDVRGRADGSKDTKLDICDPIIAASQGTTGGANVGTPGALIFSAGAVTAELIPIIIGGRNISPARP